MHLHLPHNSIVDIWMYAIVVSSRVDSQPIGKGGKRILVGIFHHTKYKKHHYY